MIENLEELYREVILDHFQSPRHRGKLADASVVAEGKNPLCGDELTLYLKLDGDKVVEVQWEGRGCSISQAASSMLTDVVRGKTIPEAGAMIEAVKQMMRDGHAPDAPDLGDVEVLSGVSKFPVRVKCALLAWTTLAEGIKDHGREQHTEFSF